jgi:hypothetical protein
MAEFLNPEVPEETPNLHESLVELFPEAETLDKDDLNTLVGLMRRYVLLEHLEERDSQNIIDVADWQALRPIIAGLPLNTVKEMSEMMDELALDPEESEIETMNWAFRHQSVGGDLLVGEDLVPFKLIRLKEHSYILLSQYSRPEIFFNFSRAFGHEPSVYNAKALLVEKQPWAGYAWFLDPDVQAAQTEAENLRLLWEGTGK